jgi:hypothetical protein
MVFTKWQSKNNATVDNHQTIQAYHQAPRKISQDSREGQASQQQLTHQMHDRGVKPSEKQDQV